MKLFDEPIRGDSSGIQGVQSYRPEYNIKFQKVSVMIMNEFLHLINPDTLKTEILGSLDCANSFWNLPDINTQLTKFIDNWAYDRKFNSRYYFRFVDCLLELMWI